MNYDLAFRESAGIRPATGPAMFNRLTYTLVKVAVASLIVGTILAHFGITIDQLVKISGLSPERLQQLARDGWAWALPNLLLGSVVIVPLWFLVYLFRPPGESPD
jgi:H+/Cl- antiporter ClcA